MNNEIINTTKAPINKQTGYSDVNLQKFQECLKAEAVRSRLNDKRSIIYASDPNFNFSLLAISPLFVLGSHSLDYVDNIKSEDKNHFNDITKTLFFTL